MAAPNLDDLLAETPDPLEAEDGEVPPEDDELGDEFSLHAKDFLDEGLDMPERIEALRNAIRAANGPALE